MASAASPGRCSRIPRPARRLRRRSRSRWTKPSRWPSSTTTICWPPEPRYNRARRRRSRRISAPTRPCSPTGNTCRSYHPSGRLPRLPPRLHGGRPRLELSVRTRQEAAAPPSGGEGRDGGDPLAGSRQRAQPYVPGRPAIHQCAACAIDPGSGAAGPEELTRTPWTSAKRNTKPAASARMTT